MNLLDRIFNRQKAVSYTLESPKSEQNLSTPEDRVGKLPAVKAAVEFRANALAQVPIHLVNEEGEKVSNLRIDGILANTDFFILLRNLEVDLLTRGVAYVRLMRSSLEYMSAADIKEPKQLDQPYEYKKMMVPFKEVIRFAEMSVGGYGSNLYRKPTAPLDVLQDSIKVAYANIRANITAQNAFSSQSKYLVGLDQRETSMSDADFEDLADILNGWVVPRDENGVKQPDQRQSADSTSLLRGKVNVANLGGRDDPAFIHIQTWFIQQVARAFGVPAPILHDLSRATYSNNTEQNRQFYRGVLTTRLRFYESVLNSAFKDVIGSDRIKFDTSNVEELQEDRNKLSERMIKELNAEIISTEEARLKLGYE